MFGGRKWLTGLLQNTGNAAIAANEWSIKNPAQQVQLQNGEQSSGCCDPSWRFASVTTVFTFPSFIKVPVSAQGITPNVKIRKAIMNVIDFIECKYKQC